jgi:hypothetical protein
MQKKIFINLKTDNSLTSELAGNYSSRLVEVISMKAAIPHACRTASFLLPSNPMVADPLPLKCRWGAEHPALLDESIRKMAAIGRFMSSCAPH